MALALALEGGSRDFYGSVRELLDDTEVAELFAKLAVVEEQHRERLLAAAEAIGLGQSATDFRQWRGLMEGAEKIDEALQWCRQPGRSPFEILELSMQVETNALDLYLRMLRRPEFDDARPALETIAGQEKEHLRRIAAHLERHA